MTEFAAAPVLEALPPLKQALAAGNAALLVAPPGAGKTTIAPLALFDESWVDGRRLIVLEPRRLAARAAADRMAATLGERVGETVGLRVRLETRVSARTRIEVVTEGVFTRMILDDPALDGVACVLFDEFHERSLDADLGLAFARDSQSLLRDDLRLLVMSATLDVAPIRALLGAAPLIESVGRLYAVETRYLGHVARLSIEDQVVRAIRGALARDDGAILVFLPGQGEILRVAERLAEQIGDAAVEIAPLYGALDSASQDRAVAPAASGRRKVILATSIAQTSLTLPDVRVVIDAGLARVPRYDPASGLTRLATVRVSRAAADQRRGRAGRTAPGVCYRLWDEAETRALIAFDRPEILETDLARLALDLARWGARDAESLAFLDRPPAGAMAEARALLGRLGALDAAGSLTRHGEAMSALPLPPRLAHMLLVGAADGQAERAARMAAVLTEQGLGGRDADLATRLDLFARDRGARGRAAGELARRWAETASRAARVARGKEDGGAAAHAARGDGRLIAEAFPERIARARGGLGEFRLANGRGAFVDPTTPLAREPWLAVADLGGGAARDRILLAARLDEADLVAAFADRMIREQLLEPGPHGLRAREVLRLDALVVSERLITAPDPALVSTALLDQVRREGLSALAWGEASASLRARLAFLRARDLVWPDVSDEGLADRLDEWLAPLLTGRTRLSAIPDAALAESLRGMMPWDLARRLEREAPSRWTAPTGSTFAVDYAAPGGPRVAVRVQELFGLDLHPTINAAPLTLALLSPAHRPIQLTQDLPGFWRGSWSEVRKEMRGRYPKHVWPEAPATTAPTTRAKARS
jgi:ATP-dependent helicase HrpB